MYVRTCDLQDGSSVFGADLYCHRSCINTYLKRYSREASRNFETGNPQKHTKQRVVEEIINDMMPGLRRGDGYTLTDIRHRVNVLLPSDNHIHSR